MSSGSVRLRGPTDVHQHGAPPGGPAGREAFPDGRTEGVGFGGERPAAGKLWREDGRLMYQDASGGEPLAARVVWARPFSHRGGAVSILQSGKKKELAFLPDLGVLPEESRRIALEELARGVVLPVISVIYEVRPRFGNYYWDVETDMGRKKFLLASPENNTYRPRPDVIVVKDVSGNCYEIASVKNLSRASRREMERVL